MKQSLGMDAAAIEPALCHQSGLLGISGEMRALRPDGGAEARAAIAVFVHRLAQLVAARAASLRGVDRLVFTGGIGEHDAALRDTACQRLAWLGVALDPAANHAGAGRIGAEASAVELWVVPTDDEAVIARHTAAVVL